MTTTRRISHMKHDLPIVEDYLRKCGICPEESISYGSISWERVSKSQGKFRIIYRYERPLIECQPEQMSEGFRDIPGLLGALTEWTKRMLVGLNLEQNRADIKRELAQLNLATRGKALCDLTTKETL